MSSIEYIVSACLAGVNCRYDGKNNAFEAVIRLVQEGRAILVCPEQLGGMATPRLASEIQCQKKDTTEAHHSQQESLLVLQNNGHDVTAHFLQGAHEALKIAQLAGCSKAIIKARSPSCGHGLIYDGSFSKKLVKGHGVFTQALVQAGFQVCTEESWPQKE